MSEKTHYFLAVRLPDPIKERLAKTKVQLENTFQFQRWVHFQDYHITLAFLGFAEENQLIAIRKLVPEFIKEEKEFSLSISHLGTFGMKTSPRIFWLGVNESEPLHTLRNKVFTACEQAGFQLEKRAFHPHITMARKWKGEGDFHPELLSSKNPFSKEALTFRAMEVVLYKTNLLQTPKYENLITFSLHE